MFIEVTVKRTKQLINSAFITKVYRDPQKIGITIIVIGTPTIIPGPGGSIGNVEATIEVEETYEEIKKLLGKEMVVSAETCTNLPYNGG